MQKLKVLLIVIILLLCTGVVFAEGITVTLNNTAITFNDVKPQLVQNRTMVPLRAIFEALGLEVGWDPTTQTVTGTKEGKKIILQVGNLKASVNDVPVALEVSAVIIGGRTMVPARFIAESVGAEVSWEPKVRNVAITYYHSEEQRLKAEINVFLNREKALFAELASEKARLDAFQIKASQGIESLLSKQKSMVARMDALKATYKPLDMSGDTYYGPMNAKNYMDGFGLYIYDNGDYYLGDIVNGKYSGTGLYQWSDDSYYIGAFANNNFHGVGLVNGDGVYYKYGTFVNDLANGAFYYQDFIEGYTFVGVMTGANFGLGRQVDQNGAEHMTWISPATRKKIAYELYPDQEFLFYEAPDPVTGFGFSLESYFGDTHMMRYLNMDTEETNGKGVSYIVGEDYVYYGEFFDRYYEMANEINYYNMTGDFYAFQNKIDSIIAEVVKEGMTDLEKEQVLHDYLVKASRYNPDEVVNNVYPAPQHMAYEIIFAGEGICEAYAEAMNILLNRVGIKSIILGGSVGEPNDQANWSGHAWNYVKIGNAYYHLDPTWNDPLPDNPNRAYQEYFNVTDAFISKTHQWKESLDEIEAFKLANPLN